ncbi:MAG TPA: T9SS type A sorting domain-containing protein [Candidatus Kapabacteria bacterium]|nr:T9SS type A sorting domain-containing protein [Candidatus Kapabacteria bacterium]
MTARYFLAPLLAIPLLAVPLAAQRASYAASPAPGRAESAAAEASGPTIPYASSSAAAPLSLRGGAVATGLRGFYDYQSNGGAPEYVAIRPGSWSTIYTTFMNSTSGADADAISASRRVGYAYSTDDGATWVSNLAISDLRLGYPDIEVSAEPVPYIAAHGDFGAGNQIAVFANPAPSQPTGFLPIAELPITTANGLADRGVIWPSFELDQAETRGVLAAAYFSDADHPANPLQVASVDLVAGTAPQRWSAIQDSLHSTASGGRYVLAKSASGRLGVAWFHSLATTEVPDPEFGIYFSESTDGGVTWSAPEGALVGEVLINGDVDTLSAGANIDGAYVGEDLHLTFTGNMNSLLRYGNILHWSRATGVSIIAMTNQVPGLGAFSLATNLRQSNMGTVSYPTMAVGDDGQHVVVAFSAVDQRPSDVEGEYVSVAGEFGFLYYRLWAVGSSDGGRTWGTPFIVQDHSGAGTDSASIEYPSAATAARMVGNDFELNVVFQGRRNPGQYASVSTTQDAGPVEEVQQYFQRFMVTPAMFQSTSSAPLEIARASGLTINTVAPNPAQDRLSVAFSVARSGEVRARVIDNLGRIARSIASHREAGLHTQTFDVSGLAAGAYRVVIEENGTIVSAPVVVR